MDDADAHSLRYEDHVPTAELFKQAMRQLAGTVTILTTRHQSDVSGMTVTAVCSLSIEPPQILVCVNRQASPHRLIQAGGLVAINILSPEHAKLAERFAGQVPVQERFASGQWTKLRTGAPVLAGATAVIDCVVSNQVDAATHTIFVCQVVGICVLQTSEPLLFAKGRFARLSPLEASKTMPMRISN